MGKISKVSLVMIGFMIIAALFVNPKDLYYQYKDKENIVKIATSAVERVEDKVEEDEIDVKYVGRDVYSVRTKANEYLIRKTKDNESNTRYHFFTGQN